MFIRDGRALLGHEISETTLRLSAANIAAVGTDDSDSSSSIDADGLLVLPGIVDLHGDAFERQMMPRPGVDFPIDVVLIDSDRQAVSNGITTVYHATTWSWEPGLRSADNARENCWRRSNRCGRNSPPIPVSICATRPTISMPRPRSSTGCRTGASTCLRSTTIWTSTVASLAKSQKRSRMVERTGLTNEAFDRLVQSVLARQPRRAGIDRPAGPGSARG